jgi:hypothetical protein
VGFVIVEEAGLTLVLMVEGAGLIKADEGWAVMRAKLAINRAEISVRSESILEEVDIIF